LSQSRFGYLRPEKLDI